VPSATYTTPRAAATAYDVASYQTAAATQFAYGIYFNKIDVLHRKDSLLDVFH